MSNAVPLWQQARDKYLLQLSPGDQDVFLAAFNPKDSIEDALGVAQNARSSSKFMKRLNAIVAPLQELVPVFDVISNINGMVGCSIWGPLKLIFQLLKQHSDALDALTDVLETLVQSMKRYVIYERLYKKSLLVHDVLVAVYYDVIDFCARCVKHFRRNTFVTVTRTIVKPFDSDFKDITTRIQRHASAVDLAALVTEMENAGIERDIQEQFRTKVKAEMLKDAKERSLQHAERAAQTKERDEQENERAQQDLFRRVAELHIDDVKKETEAQVSERELQQHERAAQEQERSRQEILRQDLARKDIEDRRKEMETRRRKLGDWLNPQNFRDAQLKRQKEHVSGTCSWFLDHPSFLDWKDKDSSLPILWLHGKPGCGKSMLASLAVHTLQQEQIKPIYFFFNARGHDAVINPTTEKSMLGTLLYQLQDINPDLVNNIYPILYRESNPASPSLDTLRSLVQLCISQSPNSDKIFCIIDGLDECVDAEQLLENIADLVRSIKNIRVLILSRLVTEVRNILEPLTGDSVENQASDEPFDRVDDEGLLVSEVKIRDSDVEAAISSYVRIRVSQSKILNHPSHRKEVIETLVSKSQGMFLWAKLIIEELKKSATPKVMKAKLALSPKSLNEVYAFILERLYNEKTGNDDPIDDGLTRCCKILKWITASTSALTVDQIAIAIAIQPGETELDEENLPFDARDQILSLCGPLVEVLENNTVQVVHLSVKEFCFQMPDFLRQKSSVLSSFCFNEKEIHAEITISLLTLLLYHQFSATAYDTRERIADEKDMLHPQLLLAYSTKNWHIHCLRCEKIDTTDLVYKMVQEYLSSNHSYLWLDSLVRNEPSWNWQHIEYGVGRVLGVARATSPSIERIALSCIDFRTTKFGRADDRTIIAMIGLTLIYKRQCRWKEAEELEEWIVETNKKALGLEHPGTITSMANLSLTYRKQGLSKAAAAEEIQKQVMENRKRKLGHEHPETITSMANLALIYCIQNRLEEAEKLQEQILEVRERTLGSEHPKTLFSKDNIAKTYMAQGRFKEAAKLQEQAIETQKRLLGPEHSHTLSVMYELGSTYWSQGRLKEAEELHKQVMEGRKKVLGAQHPTTLESITKLASIYRDQGRRAEAEELDDKLHEESYRLGSEEGGCHNDGFALLQTDLDAQK